jgi:hypothetical protein
MDRMVPVYGLVLIFAMSVVLTLFARRRNGGMGLPTPRAHGQSSKGYWFPARGLLSWQGYASLLIYLAAIWEWIVYARTQHCGFALRVSVVLLITALFGVLVFKKGDPDRYRWRT